jgi:hypothetical protein
MAKNGFSMSNRVAVETISASKTLTVDDCGKRFVVETAGSTATVTLPSPASAEAGWNVAFIFESGSAAGNTTIESTAANINLRGLEVAASAEGFSTTTAQTRLVVSGSQVKNGDIVELVVAGGEYHARSFMSGGIAAS